MGIKIADCQVPDIIPMKPPFISLYKALYPLGLGHYPHNPIGNNFLFIPVPEA